MKYLNINLEESEKCTFGELQKTAKVSIEHLKPKNSANLDQQTLYNCKQKYKDLKKKVELFHSLFYLENLMRITKVEKRTLGKQVIRINDSSSIIREEIYHNECLIEDNIMQIEILMENEQANGSMIGYSCKYLLGNLHGIFMFLKIKNFTLGYEKNDKLNINDAIELLGEEYYKRSSIIKKSGLYDPELSHEVNFKNL